ncbi:ATP-dependent zinc metalloprotease FtsH [Fluviicola taffensis]|uniref:ATP-dependent zinc metalloprotease FtsH n=1 Tax=Fluviicola taffensis (strain DSM 16823 / NCIMB 13979 / RW262) TaxID=755732 RepID=F2IFF9_FLUTR|nr:ATP-dependent zinc metalloprotease FtsH [Fluviicola taffensis]AEA44644.1 membrane protease FtsH catalytic subunit [Fluviicola taffensis DSM 16823]
MAENNNSNKPKKNPYAIYWIYAVIVLGIIVVSYYNRASDTPVRDVRTFYTLADSSMIAKAQIVNRSRVDFTLNEKGEKFVKNNPKGELKYLKATLEKKGSAFNQKGSPTFSIDILDAGNFETKLDEINERLAKKGKATISAPPIEEHDYFSSILSFLLPLVIIALIWVFVMRRMSGGGGGAGGQIFNIGKSRAQVYEKGKSTNITFKDVAGLEGAKEEIQEIVEFLRSPQRYTDLGAKIPKGALLVGPPGTGKTLLAKAVAGEAKVPFFSLSGSDFVEMFVGVGASRVRDLFRQAKEKAPAIIFIDEIDAIGRARGKNNGFNSNDERENTLNQLLTEMDGFGTNSGVIILAATNRADVLDAALMRAGRFDRQIYVDMPDLNERKEIFQVHLKPIKLEKNMDVDFLSKQTPGFSGADIANLCNEAALIAARQNKKFVEKQDFLDAVDRIIGGLEKKNKIITKEEKRSIAFHEAGHATTSWLLEHAHPLVKVTIVPRGRSLGAAWYLPEERQITTTEQILDDMCSALGGRAAEQLIFGKISTGALSDLEKVTKQAYAMVSIYGLNDRVGNVSFYDSQGRDSFTKPYSEDTARIIDEEASKLIETQYQRALKILSENKDKLSALADKLLDKEVIFKEDLEEIFGKRLWASEEEVNMAINTPPNEDSTIDINPEDSFNNESSNSESNVINPTIEPLDNNVKSEE